jgi:two-component system, chemotaxis family, protein-glutamate methylesterase/glutaminase
MAQPPDCERDQGRSDPVSSGGGLAPRRMAAGVVAVGASAGGVEALQALVAGLPKHLQAVVLVVLHIPRQAPSALPGILTRAGPLPAVAAKHGMPARTGTIYVAPADHHLLICDGLLELSVGPTENGHRPAIDPLFRSAAVAFGAGAIGVVLSGARDDGAAGLAEIVKRGGQAVVQDPNEALHRSMPASALEHVATAHVVPAAKIGPLLVELVGEGAPPIDKPHPNPNLAGENEIAAMGAVTTEEEMQPAHPSGFSCPSCQGVLFELDGEPAPRYRCRVGHAWSPATFVAEQTVTVEEALWVALRTLEENAAINLRLAEVAGQRERRRAAALYRGHYERGKAEAMRLRELIAWVSSAAEDESS